jgi:uncharacterized protein (DUF1800 family)
MPATDIVSSQDAAHLLRRVGFGPTAAEIQALTGLTRQAAVASVMDFTGAPAVVRPAVDDRDNQWDCYVNAQEWWVERMRTTNKPLQEKMTLFWHNHFCSGQDKLFDMTAMFDQNLKFRTLGMGNFETLCQQIAVDPAMLVYLDNATNRVGAEQENFARELMELFTLGVGHYTEQDVIAMAKAWTGHNIVGWNGSFTDPTYVYYPARHDNTVKTLFGIAQNWNGPQTITEIVNNSKKSECSLFIARKMWKYFAHTEPSDALVNALAAVFAGSMVISDLVGAILLHDEFWSATSRWALVKSPVEFVVDVLRRIGRPSTVAGLPWAVEGMGQLLFNPPNVAGWGQNAYWLSTATAWARGGWLSHLKWQLDGWNFWDEFKVSGGGALPAATAAQKIFDDLGIFEPSNATRSQLIAWWNAEPYWARQPNALIVGAMCPEFNVV